jgi:hypothetical protein
LKNYPTPSPSLSRRERNFAQAAGFCAKLTYAFAPQFLRDFAALDPGLKPDGQRALDALMAAVVARPGRADRFATFYDPDHPSWMIRSDPFLIHYAYDDDRDEVTFLNVFRRR